MEQLRYLVGHAPQHAMPAHYGGRPKGALLNEHMQRLDYGIDLVGILGRWDPPKCFTPYIAYYDPMRPPIIA